YEVSFNVRVALLLRTGFKERCASIQRSFAALTTTPALTRHPALNQGGEMLVQSDLPFADTYSGKTANCSANTQSNPSSALGPVRFVRSSSDRQDTALKQEN